MSCSPFSSVRSLNANVPIQTSDFQVLSVNSLVFEITCLPLLFFNILIFTFFYLATCYGRLYSFHTNEIYLNKTYLLTYLLTDWLAGWLAGVLILRNEDIFYNFLTLLIATQKTKILKQIHKLKIPLESRII